MNTYVVTTAMGQRCWQADDADHAIDQHIEAHPDEPVLLVGLRAGRNESREKELLDRMDELIWNLALRTPQGRAEYAALECELDRIYWAEWAGADTPCPQCGVDAEHTHRATGATTEGAQ